MTNKKLLENIIIDCEYYGKDKATIDIETIRSVLKDLDKLELIKVLAEKYNNDEMHFTRNFNFINILKEVLDNDK